MGKFDKKEACEYCKEKMEAKYRSKRFCSTKCRVYWNRENKKKKPPPVVNQSKPDQLNPSFWEKMRNKRLGM